MSNEPVPTGTSRASHRRPTRRSLRARLRRARRWVSASALVIIALLVSAASVAIASAGTPGHDPANGSWVGGLRLAPGPEPLVLWRLPGSGGRVGTCIYANIKGPLTGPYSKRTTIDDAVFGELNHLYATESASDVQLAELSALNGRKYDRVDRGLQWSYVVNGQGGMSVADANRMLTRASDLAGPDAVTVSWPAGDVMADTAYQATVAVTSASGVPVPGAAVALSGTNVTLSTASTTTNAAGRATVGYRIPVGTSSTFTISAYVQSWTTVDVFASPGEQDMLVTGAPSTQSGQHTGPIARARAVDLVKVDASDPTNTPVPGYTYEITDSSGKVVDASVTTGSSAAAAPLGSLMVGATYYAKEIGVPTGAHLYIPAQPTTAFTVTAGLGPWTLVAKDPAIPTPTIGTQVNAQNAIIGQQLSDLVTVAGDDGEDATIHATLYGPVIPGPSGACSDLTLAQYLAAPAQAFTQQVSGSSQRGNGVHRVLGPVVTETGCWGWAETLTLAPSGASASSPPTTPNESTLVSLPQLTTTASAQIAAPGFVLSDRVLITGMSGQGGTLLATLYGPLPAEAGGCRYYSDAAWRAAQQSAGPSLVAGTTTSRVAGDGTYITTPVTLSRSGCYTYQEVLTPDSTPSTPVATRYGLPSESTLVVTPSIITRASANRVEVGGAISDQVTVTGTFGTSGTVAGELLGPIPDHSGSCAGLDWSRAPIAAPIPPRVIAGDLTFRTPESRLSAPGCYTFVESLFLGGASTPVLRTTPGLVTETIIVRQPVPITPGTPGLATTGVSAMKLVLIGLSTAIFGAVLTTLGMRTRRRG
ncbi:MAG: hypothetical protein M3N95_04345 [Actinomycetota bacterium]|nr:hypothetical protein [Actinomycetota bacterium]